MSLYKPTLKAPGHSTQLKALHCLPTALAIKSESLPLPTRKVRAPISFPTPTLLLLTVSQYSPLSAFTLTLISLSRHMLHVSSHSLFLATQVTSIPHQSHHLMPVSSQRLSLSMLAHSFLYHLFSVFLSSFVTWEPPPPPQFWVWPKVENQKILIKC